jgi:hypothetical protein
VRQKIKEEIMLSRIAIIALAALLMIGFVGCYKGNTVNPLQQESLLDQNWGRSFEAAKHNQTLNPDADKNLAPVEGIDGPAAERIMREYTEGGKQKPQQSGGFGVINIQR